MKSLVRNVLPFRVLDVPAGISVHNTDFYNTYNKKRLTEIILRAMFSLLINTLELISHILIHFYLNLIHLTDIYLYILTNKPFM